MSPKKDKDINKLAAVSVLLLPIPAKTPKEVVEISNFFKKNLDNKGKKSYAQVSSANTNTARETLKIKEAFPNLQNKKIENIQKIISSDSKTKPQLNITTKGPSQKQFIVSMNSKNVNNFMKELSSHITNINKVLKNIKSDVIADFICIENSGLVITTNKVASALDLQTIEKYIKNIYNIEANYVKSPRLSQSKSFLKIISIPYISESTNTCISTEEVIKIIKENHIFNNIILASRPRIIKVSPKSDMLIIWFDIWDAQSGAKAKRLINRCFNVGRYIASIHGTNMNLGVPQYKNC